MAQHKLQLTLAVMKPHVVAHPHRVQEIKEEILKHKFYFVKSKVTAISSARAKDFYKEHEGRFFYGKLVSYMTSGPVSAHILAREDAIAQWRNMMGPTRALQAMYKAPNSLRSIYGLTDTKNSVHGSDSDQSVRREVDFYFPEFTIEDWFKNEEMFFRKDMVTFDPELCQHILTTKGRSESTERLEK